jgi:hypothetical protein
VITRLSMPCGGIVHGVESPLEHCCEKYAVTVAVPDANAFTVVTSCVPSDEVPVTDATELLSIGASPSQPPGSPIPAWESSKVTVSVAPTSMQIELLDVATGTDAVPETQSLDVGLVGLVVGGVDGATVVGVEVWGNEPEDGVVVLVGAPAVSGLTHPAGGADVPLCPGMSTVPAQPKFDKMVSSLTIEPSGRVY